MSAFPCIHVRKKGIGAARASRIQDKRLRHLQHTASRSLDIHDTSYLSPVRSIPSNISIDQQSLCVMLASFFFYCTPF